nr:receptor-like protein kinase feronia [Quercus suber]
MHTLVLYLFLFALLPYLVAATENPQLYTATDYFLLNCGLISNLTSNDGQKWEDDAKFSLPYMPNTSLVSTASKQDPSVEIVPYMTALSYSDGLDITKSYFSVTANSLTLLSNYSAYLNVFGTSSPLANREFIINVLQTDEKLNITFIPSPSSYAFINGIEVVSMPNNLYTDHTDYSVTFVGNNHFYNFDDTTALETLYRVNVAGQDISSVHDTGMYRVWEQDEKYIFGGDLGTTPFLSNAKIQYSDDTPAYTAPETVYRTYRTMNRDSHVNLKTNLTWFFTVDVGFLYLVRLHFCETQLEVTEENERVFTIFINNQTAEREADVIHWSGGSKIPVYKDYVVSVQDEKPGKQELWLALHPNMNSKPEYANAILNGLEIFKLSKTDGSLSGLNPDPIPSTSPPIATRDLPLTKPKHNLTTTAIIAIAVGAIFGIALLSVLSFLIFRRRKRVKDLGKTKSNAINGSSLPSVVCRYFSFSEIRAATNSFDDVLIIGFGGFGNVYKAYGLQYLHAGAKHTVIHRDVKSTNILLDENWVAKVSDFGLSKLGPTSLSKTHVSTEVKGSFGYMDPEYYRLQQLTEKSDVYSFGVVLCEVLSARAPLLRTAKKNQMSLVDWAQECYRNQMLDEIVDSFLEGSIVPESLKKFGEVAVSCLLDDGIKRPSMNDVVWGLEFALQLHESPKNISLDETKIEMVDIEKPLYPMDATGDSSDNMFSSSSELVWNSKASGVTMISSEEQNFDYTQSDKLMSGNVFSELMHANGR